MPQTFSVIELNAELPDADNRRWVHLMPNGIYRCRDGRGPFDARDQEGIIKASRKYAGRRLIPMDFDHQLSYSAKNGQPAIAAGWISDLEARPDGIWGLAKFTDRASAHIAAKEFRYLSPMFTAAEPEGGRGAKKVQIILAVGLVNMPALDQLVALSANTQEITNMDNDFANQLLALLGLTGPINAATQQAALDKIKDLLDARSVVSASAIPDPSQYVSIGDFERAVSDANALRQGLNETSAKEHVASLSRAGHLTPGLTDWAVELCKVNKPALDAFVQRTGPAFIALTSEQFSSRGPKSTVTALSDEETRIAANLNLTSEQFLAARAPDTL